MTTTLATEPISPTRAFLSAHSLTLLTACLVAVTAARLGVSAELPAMVAFVFGGVLLAAIDWKVHRLPRTIVYRTMAAVAVGLVFAAVVEAQWQPLVTAAVGALAFANAFFLVWFLTSRFAGMRVIGYGDIRLAALLGMVLGWYGIPTLVYGAALGHLFALVIAVAISLRSGRLRLDYAFGPPLLAGAFVVVLVQG